MSTLTYGVRCLAGRAGITGTSLLELNADPFIQLDAVTFPCGPGSESFLNSHGLQFLRQAVIETVLREILPNDFLRHYEI